MNKREEALQLSEEVLTQIEMDQISVSSSLLRARRIARLISDFEASEWLTYECEGYTRTENGKIENRAFKIAIKYGRGLFENKEQRIFSELATTLEAKIATSSKSLGNFTTSGVSVGGDNSFHAMNRLTNAVSQETSNLNQTIITSQSRLTILKNKYYDYILHVYNDLKFSNQVEQIFNIYKDKVGTTLIEMAPETHKKLIVLEEIINTEDSEKLSQVLTTCRRLMQEFTESLFEKVFPDYKERTYKTISGKEIEIDGDKYKNKLSAVIEVLQNKSEKKTLLGSHIIFMLDWIENILNVQCKGVHSNITKEEATRCIIHTYICIGDILTILHPSE